MAILATLLGCQGVEEFRYQLGAALNFGVTPVEVKEIVYQAVAYLGAGHHDHGTSPGGWYAGRRTRRRKPQCVGPVKMQIVSEGPAALPADENEEPQFAVPRFLSFVVKCAPSGRADRPADRPDIAMRCRTDANSAV